MNSSLLLLHSANEKLNASRKTITKLIQNCPTRLYCIYDGAGAFSLPTHHSQTDTQIQQCTTVHPPTPAHSSSDDNLERARWLNIRKNAVALNASSMPAICGGNFFQTPEQAARSRVLKGTRFMDPVAHDRFWSLNTNVQRGVCLEPVAKRCFERTTGYTVAELSSSAIFTNNDILNGLLGGTPDGFIIHEDDYPHISLLEIKCPKKCTKGALRNYRHQLQSYLHLFGLEQGYLFQYVNEEDHMLLTVERDPLWLEEITPHVDHFIRLCESYDAIYSQSLFNTLRK